MMGSEGTLIMGDRRAPGKLILYPEPKFSEAQRYAVECWPKKMREAYFASFANAEQPPEPVAKEIAIERGPQHHEYFIFLSAKGSRAKKAQPMATMPRAPRTWRISPSEKAAACIGI